jgi:hypothetical protein
VVRPVVAQRAARELVALQELVEPQPVEWQLAERQLELALDLVLVQAAQPPREQELGQLQPPVLVVRELELVPMLEPEPLWLREYSRHYPIRPPHCVRQIQATLLAWHAALRAKPRGVLLRHAHVPRSANAKKNSHAQAAKHNAWSCHRQEERERAQQQQLGQAMELVPVREWARVQLRRELVQVPEQEPEQEPLQ